jgi:hypothetical protein
MKRIIFSLLIGSFILSGCNTSHALRVAPTSDTTSLESVLKLLNNDYDNAMKYLGVENKVQVCSASVTFAVSNTKTVGGDLTILVFKPGYAQSWNRETIMTFNLERPKEPRVEMTKPELTDNLQKAIVNAALQFYKIQNSPNLGGLIASNFSIEIDFVITRTGELGLALLSDVVKIDGKVEGDVTQKINLTFAFPGQCPK